MKTFRYAVLIVTHSKFDNVINLINILNDKAKHHQAKLNFFVGISGMFPSKEKLAMINSDVSLSCHHLPDDSFWARSFHDVFDCIDYKNFDMFMHLNDDLDPVNLISSNVFSIFKKDIITFADIYDINERPIFGGRIIKGVKFIFDSKNVDVFNTNFFCTDMSLMVACMPKYKFSHAFLDYALSYRLLRSGKSIYRCKFLSIHELQTDRIIHFKKFRNFKNSRLNPIDSFMLHWYLQNYFTSLFVFFYCISKIIFITCSKGRD